MTLTDIHTPAPPRRKNRKLGLTHSKADAPDDRRAYMREWYRRTTGAVPIGTEISCSDCDTLIVKTSSTHKRCGSCIRTRTRDRHRKANPGLVPLGGTIRCDICDKETIKKASRQKRCIGCKAKWRADRQRRVNGTTILVGETITCVCCGGRVVKRGGKQKYCEGCRLHRPEYTINQRMSAMIRSVLKRRGHPGAKRYRSWESLVGYTAEELMAHLEKQFTDGMSWENRGKWHIDHRQPLAAHSFNSVDDPGFKAAWQLSNLQPLWALENKKKSDKRLHLL